jgi:hypothetical protein
MALPSLFRGDKFQKHTINFIQFVRKDIQVLRLKSIKKGVWGILPIHPNEIVEIT